MNNVMNELSTIGCEHFGSCSGCTLNDRVDDPPIWSEMKKSFASWGLSDVNRLYTGRICGWRVRAKLAVRGTKKDPIIGLFRKGTHQALSIPNCKTHHPSINLAVAELREALIAEGIEPYREDTSMGDLRYIQCTVEETSGKVQLVLVWNALMIKPAMRALVARLSKNPFWHSIWFNYQTGKTNTIFGQKWESIHGPQFLPQTIHDLTILFHPAAFIQAHWSLFRNLALSVSSEVPQGSKLLEVYAGVGAMGMLSAAKCRTVDLIESNPYSQLSFQATNRCSNVQYHAADASHATSYLAYVDCVIADPPRKGLDRSLINELKHWRGKLIYVSCDFTSFQRDVDDLLQSGWSLQKAEGYLLFPGTNHVETVGILSR